MKRVTYTVHIIFILAKKKIKFMEESVRVDLSCIATHFACQPKTLESLEYNQNSLELSFSVVRDLDYHLL